ncbi:type II toxin-antitoxin system ParD family antitoxin [Thiomicrorhabdus sp. 6S2-11]|uniref:Antitoxin ParD n=1 Tax=Thiomicrorhabdus marina TaxID=2818442 RepID=A0ABS3Q3D1_9GAMM|nr:type II toxin-antitoxin system ParD family antitoxin [Thiomicrorhabdus marina]MBO1926796.1 type II toxin-antitoxin system ParD family antitoxin [Thiomicrorhabdus marina]
MHRKTITLTDQQDSWIKSQVELGHFGNDSECIRSLLRKEMLRNEAEAELSQMIDDAEKSGLSEKTPKMVWDSVVSSMKG